MSKILKHATVEQAEQAYAQNSFVYNNPCCKCAKECSTPTMEIWLRRINEFGGVRQMYEQYKCRNCRKDNKAKDVQSKAANPMVQTIAKDPITSITKQAPMMKKKAERPMVQIKPEPTQLQPGDFVEQRPGHFAFSVWENGVHQGTTWYKYNEPQIKETNK